jgi:hypothetical protein
MPTVCRSQSRRASNYASNLPASQFTNGVTVSLDAKV